MFQIFPTKNVHHMIMGQLCYIEHHIICNGVTRWNEMKCMQNYFTVFFFYSKLYVEFTHKFRNGYSQDKVLFLGAVITIA